MPSDEQKNIINNVFMNKNIRVNAVSGSGKSTCVLSMAAFLDKKILQVTFNKSLRHEVQRKAILWGLSNLKIHTYHSLAVKHYDRLAYMDNRLENIVLENKPIIYPEYYDIIVIDEAQDMSIDTYQIIRKYIRDAGINPVIVIMGDEYQAVYEFKGANRRFLTLSNHVWNKPFIELPLKTSYRVTNQIASFVNNMMVGQDRITACKDGPKIDYILGDGYKCNGFIYNIITGNNYLPGDVFILLASVRSAKHTPFRALENIFVSAGWPVYVSDNDESDIDDKITENKVVFSTFHQSKGRERKVVVVLGFDMSYFKFFGRDLDPFKCPATLYVAVTRSSHHLIIQDNSAENGPLPFMNMKNIMSAKYMNVYGYYKAGQIKKDGEKTDFEVTNLTRFIRPNILCRMIKIIDILFVEIKPAGIMINLKNIVSNENVADINGIVIPLIHEYLRLGRSKIVEYINKEEIDSPTIKGFDVSANPNSLEDFIRIAIKYHAINTGLLFKLIQIKEYNWLTINQINECLKHMPANPIDYEVSVARTVDKYTIHGRIDVFDSQYIYELKCTDSLSVEHKIQLIMYAAICGAGKNYRLINLKTGQVLELQNNWPAIMDIFRLVIDNRLVAGEVLDNEDFIQQIQLANLEMDIKYI